MSDANVTHNEEQSRFEATTDGQVSVLDYRRDGDVMTMTHTGVPSALRGRGIAGKLTAAALGYAREHHPESRSRLLLRCGLHRATPGVREPRERIRLATPRRG